MRRWLGALASFSLLSACATTLGTSDARLEAVRDAVQEVFPEVSREDVRPAAAPGLFEIRRGAVYAYVTADGRYLIRGELIDLQSGEVLTERRRRQVRAEAVKRLSDSAIEYAPPTEQLRQTVHIFVDVDCDYCRQLHREVPAINAKGIAVRYLFYPRRGERSQGYADAERAYCATDRRQALDGLFAGQQPEEAKTDCENPVAEHYAAALAIGVKGTPMIVLPDGGILYGYVSAAGLEQVLAPNMPAPAPQPEAAAAP